jgi:hypothetical protein
MKQQNSPFSFPHHPSSPEHGEQDVVVGPTVGRSTKKKKREWFKQKQPWDKQHLGTSQDGWVGVRLKAHTPVAIGSPMRSTNGGWLLKDEYLAAYSAGTSESGMQKKIGKYYSPKEAMEKLEEAKTLSTKPIVKGINFPKPPDGLQPEDELLFAKGIETVWCRGTGCYAPKAGSMNKGRWSSTEGNDLYEPFTSEKKLLPLFMRSSSFTESDQQIVDAFVIDNLDTGAFVMWDFEKHGYPTVVSPMKVAHRTVIADELGATKDKKRLVTDFRYANGVSHNGSMSLPTPVSFGVKLKRHHETAKQDAKAGFHQLAVNLVHQHMMAVEWRGIILCYTCAGFGIRNAPEVYTKRTQLASKEATEHVKAKNKDAPEVEDVYVDDFLQGWCPGDDIKPFILAILERGVVLGKSKCVEPRTVQEVLGLMIDAKNRRLFVSDEKLSLLIAEMSLLCRDSSESIVEHVTTLRVAQIVGRLNAVEAAVPNIVLLIRPLFEDLKVALAEINVHEEIPKIHRSGDASHYIWENVPLILSEFSVEALVYLRENLRSINGQSLDLPEENITLRWDASSYAVGITIMVRDKQTSSWVVLHEDTIYMEQYQHDQSSLAREAIALLEAVKWLQVNRPDLLKESVIRGVTDNQGLARVYWKGSTKLPASLPLIEVVRILRAAGAVLQSVLWLPRELMEREDKNSKPEGMQPVSSCSQKWFDEWMSSLESSEKPNVDAFASKEDHRLPAYATIECNGTFIDGASHQWQADQILWVFPPSISTLFKKLFENWKQSASPLAYFCVGVRGWTRSVELLKREGAQLMIDVRPEVVLGTKNSKVWEFQVFRARK